MSKGLGKRRVWRKVGPGVAALATVVGACGGGPPPAPTRAAFDKTANGICASTNTAQQKVPQPKARSAQALGPYVGQVAGLSQKELDSLRALTPPKGQEAEVKAVLGIDQQQVDLAKKLAQQLGRGDATDASTTYRQLNALTPSVNSSFDSLGLSTCGSKSALNGGAGK